MLVNINFESLGQALGHSGPASISEHTALPALSNAERIVVEESQQSEPPGLR